MITQTPNTGRTSGLVLMPSSWHVFNMEPAHPSLGREESCILARWSIKFKTDFYFLNSRHYILIQRIHSPCISLYTLLRPSLRPSRLISAIPSTPTCHGHALLCSLLPRLHHCQALPDNSVYHSPYLGLLFETTVWAKALPFAVAFFK